MEWSGERLETFINDSNTIEHLHRYALTFEYIKGKRVLDIACGEGYGSNIMAMHANYVTGVDISEHTILNAQKKYQKDNLLYKIGDASAIPVDNKSVDVVVSFETIEHHTRHEEMLLEIKRVLKENGVLLMSSPDKRFYSDERNYNNSYHLKELYSEEFKNLIDKHFKNTNYFLQNIFIGSLIIPEGKSNTFQMYNGDYNKININNFNPLYNIVIASDDIISTIPSASGFKGEKEILFNKIALAEEKVKNNYLNSRKYKIGKIVLLPFTIIKKKIKSK